MRDGKAETVVEQFDWLTAALGLDTFRKLFPIILTDNGSEFKHTREMEFTVDGQRRTRIYYCTHRPPGRNLIREEPRVYPLCSPSREELQPLHAGRYHSFAQPHQQHQTQQAGRKTPFELADSEEFLKLKEVMDSKYRQMRWI